LPSTSPSVTVFAPAKVNLILRILDRRPDGCHNLWSIMQTVALEDEVRIALSNGRRDIRLRCDSAQLAADPSNLVYKAAAAVLDRAPTQVGLDIELRKRIPMGAGLGGGSSDAAATILGLNHLLQLRWSQAQMAEVAQPLGSDVPFFLFAPTASVSGRGEVVRAVRLEGERWIVLVNPGFGVETKWAYQELASTRGAVRPLSPQQEAMDQQPQLKWDRITAGAENDFETPVLTKHGILRDIKLTLLAQGAELALLSGSGATVFGVFMNKEVARQAQLHFSGDKRLKVFVVPTCSGPLTMR
jgi:4-diphosphocytidyl-2-C-methyl-D-erythritol kinase